jgi:hypothetical protein
LCGPGIVESTTQQDLPNAFVSRAVRITFHISESMMFSVRGHPLSSYHACGQPQPESHKMCDTWIKGDASVCLTAMQVKCDTDYGDVCHHQDVDK